MTWDHGRDGLSRSDASIAWQGMIMLQILLSLSKFCGCGLQGAFLAYGWVYVVNFCVLLQDCARLESQGPWTHGPASSWPLPNVDDLLTRLATVSFIPSNIYSSPPSGQAPSISTMKTARFFGTLRASSARMTWQHIIVRYFLPVEKRGSSDMWDDWLNARCDRLWSAIHCHTTYTQLRLPPGVIGLSRRNFYFSVQNYKYAMVLRSWLSFINSLFHKNLLVALDFFSNTNRAL
jgi:hypothetical protein